MLEGQQRLTFGRAADNDVVLGVAEVSGHHACIQSEGGRHVLTDLGSTNGTWVKGQRVQRHILVPGDTFKIGSALLTYNGHAIRITGATAVVRKFDAHRAGTAAGSASRLYLGCLAVMLIVTIVGFAGSIIVFASVARELPDPTTLEQRLSRFRSAWMYDRNGKVLSEAFDPNAGRRTIMPLDRIAPTLVQATVATEDAHFYEHGGVDPVALARAAWYALSSGRIVSGASTIPQQLVKLAFLSPERTVRRKIKEAILASEISRRYTKEQILSYYLNEVYYGNMAYGIEAAAQTYFGKAAADLTLPESALLAGLPQAPAYYDPHSYPERAKQRQMVVLGLTVKAGYIDAVEAEAAGMVPLSYAMRTANHTAPHFVLWVREQVEKRLGPEAVYRTGLSVTTSLDANLQAEAEAIVSRHVDGLAGRDVGNGSLVALRPDTGEVLAFVGSKDFNDAAISGQVNMAMAPRQPGSALKPFVYVAVFGDSRRLPAERWTPGTLVPDFLTEFNDGMHAPYTPANYDGQEHGLVTVREALGNSYNIPAVRALEAATVPEFVRLARLIGLPSLNRDDYGLPIALGAAEVPLVDLTAAYGVFAQNGRRVQPIVIRKIVDDQGKVVCEIGTQSPCQDPVGPVGEQLIDPVDAFLITDILSDNIARTPAFGPRSPLLLGRPAAAKTGTTNDFRDNWTVGYTPQLVTGVWVGNADNRPMQGMTGITGAAPIWNEFMTAALASLPGEDFTPPAGLRQFEVCSDTGTLPSPACPNREMGWFAEDRPPLPPERDLWQMVRLDTRNGLLANGTTPPEAIEERAFKVYPVAYRAWAESHGIPQPPTEISNVEPPDVAIAAPIDGETVTGLVSVIGTAAGAEFGRYSLDFGTGSDPQVWTPLLPAPIETPVDDGVLGTWDTSDLADGPYTLRLIVEDGAGNVWPVQVQVNIGGLGAASATPTATPTLDGTVLTPTATVTIAVTATDTPTPELPSLLRWLLER